MIEQVSGVCPIKESIYLDEIQSSKWFCTAFYGASMDETIERVASNFVP